MRFAGLKRSTTSAGQYFQNDGHESQLKEFNVLGSNRRFVFNPFQPCLHSATLERRCHREEPALSGDSWNYRGTLDHLNRPSD
jgi:hypothetical protein